MPLSSRLAGLLTRDGIAREIRTAYELVTRPQAGPRAEPVEELPLAAQEPASGRLRILFAGPRYDYGDPRRGPGVEETYFLTCLQGMGHRVLRFDAIELARRVGRGRANERLLESAKAFEPDVLFSVMYRDELDPDTVARLTSELGGRTVTWFSDDHWRLESYSRHWAPLYGLAVTTSASALERYRALGIGNVHRSQWGCNHYVYRPTGSPFAEDVGVTFVGQPHGDRATVVRRLRRAGIPVTAWGLGWPNGRLTFTEMLRVFTQSPISLNLSNASVGSVAQIKGRDFEVPGCRGFLLTQASDELLPYYTPGVEIETYADVDGLIEKARHYLDHPDERDRVAAAGYARTLAEHTMEHRLSDVLGRLLG